MSCRDVLNLFRMAAVKWSEDGMSAMGAAIAFYTLFSIGPILVLSSVVGTVIVGSERVIGLVSRWAGENLGPQAASAIVRMVDNAKGPESGLGATILGSLLLLFAAMRVFMGLDHSLHAIWRAKAPQRSFLRGFLVRRFVSLGGAVMSGLVIVILLVLSTVVPTLGPHLARYSAVPAFSLFLVHSLTALMLMVPLVAFLFRYLPPVRTPWRSVLSGAVVAVVLLQAGTMLVGWYIRSSAFVSALGAMGSLLAIQIWAYYSAQMILYGAEFTRVHAQRYNRPSTGGQTHATR